LTALKIGFAGMTHLGLNSAVASAAKGVSVQCYDPDPEKIKRLQAGHPDILEPELAELMQTHGQRLDFSDQVEQLQHCKVVYIAPDVPTDDHGLSDLTPVTDLIEKVDRGIPPEIVLVLLSQVPPGFSRSVETRPGRKFYYQVETLIFGLAIQRALHPERFIIGCKEPEQELDPDYKAYLDLFGCPRLPMRYESAELTKIAINCCLVSSITVANTLAELCEHLEADWSEVVPALKLDKRIGKHAYLSPGLGIAGGNLERDLKTVMSLSNRYGTDSGVVEAWVQNSRYRKNWVLRLLNKEILPELKNPEVAVWGLAYKQNTHSIKNSPSLEFIRGAGDMRLTAYDPVVRVSDTPFTHVKQAEHALDACRNTDILVIMTPWPAFTEIKPGAIVKHMRGRIIVDPFRVLNPVDCRDAGLIYYTLGA